MANDETYSDEQREEVRARLQRFQDEQKAINDQIRILKGRYSNQIYQIRESIMKFLDKEIGTLDERIRTLFKEQGITIVSILTALGMTIGVLIEALLGGPSNTSTPTSESTATSDKKGGAREWIKNKLKALSQLLGKLADEALASLPGICSEYGVSNDLTTWRNQKYFSTWQSRAWETGKPGMSYINENSFSRWIIEKSDGLTTLGLQKLSESVRDYAYLILTSQTSTRGPIIGHEARNLDAQRTFLNTFENIVNRRVNIPEDIQRFQIPMNFSWLYGLLYWLKLFSYGSGISSIFNILLIW